MREPGRDARAVVLADRLGGGGVLAFPAELLKAVNARLVAENVTLAATAEVQRRQVEALMERVVTLNRMLFGASTEKGERDGAAAGPAVGRGDERQGEGGARRARPTPARSPGRRGAGP